LFIDETPVITLPYQSPAFGETPANVFLNLSHTLQAFSDLLFYNFISGIFSGLSADCYLCIKRQVHV
jgi:hypothetical protein